jgi:hypothetical protein
MRQEKRITVDSEKNISSRRLGISGSTLKIIAVISMLIDHIGAGILGRVLNGWYTFQTAGNVSIIDRLRLVYDYGDVYRVYIIMRYIGRIAFPIYCFLLVEGFERTHDLKKYIIRMGIFSLVSEIPFDLCFKASFLEFSYQNVFFTLFIGLLVMTAVDAARKRFVTDDIILNKIIYILILIICTGAGAFVAELLSTDYGADGIICIMVLYIFKESRIAQAVAGAVAFLWEYTAPLAFIPILLYNGKRGLKLKYFFYAFYPVHLLIIYFVCIILKISDITAF